MEFLLEDLARYWIQLKNFLVFDAARLAEPGILFRLSLQVCLLFGSAFFSGSETALFSLSDVDLEQVRRQRHPRTDLLHNLLSQPRRLIISILCGNELINIAATANMAGILLTLYGAERAGLINIIEVMHIMTPRTQMHFVELRAGLPAAAAELSRHRLLRLAVYDQTRDNIRGFVHVEDVTAMVLKGKDLSRLRVAKTDAAEEPLPPLEPDAVQPESRPAKKEP
jgi:Mg2+/Co2+ transporter CorB